MTAGIIGTRVRALRRDTLVRNSMLLLVSTVVVAAGGFVFWQIAARLFSPADVGRTSALITASALIANLALLGMQNSVIRFLHDWEDRAATVNSAVTVVALASVAGAVVFVAGVDWFAPELAVLHRPGNAVLFVVFTASLALTLLNDNVLIALQRSGHVAGRNTATVALRLILPFGCVGLGAFGLFTAYQSAATLALVVYLVLLHRELGLPTRLRLDTARIATMWRYSAGNYVATVLLLLPALVMPNLITHSLGPERAAYYYIASLIAGVLTFVPQATARSLFAHASADPGRLPGSLRRVVVLTAAVQIPALLVIVGAGPFVLRLFGPDYAQAYPLLVVLAVGAALASVSFVGSTLMLIAGRMRVMCALTGLAALISVGGAYLFGGHGLLWIGAFLLAGELVQCVTYTPIIARMVRARAEDPR
ncbi:lipopolysaccharide biosynthesis protein [Krasilnikovia sp. MM14-A1259]|uniref:lipopolysaccharide biosynthesis protein n=1 Tax=Krasilnikovia sp. MM14-A1259 TaxID=3373539 RepID=UPI003830A0DC